MTSPRMTRPELLASFYTIAGDAVLEFRGGDEISPFDIKDRIETAARVGYKGVGLADRDLEHWGRVYAPAELRRIIEGNGIEHVELEMIFTWFADGELRRTSDRIRSELLRWAEALGARHIKVGTDLSGAYWPIELMAQEFAVLCAQAADVGAMVALEPMPPATVKTPWQGLEVIEAAGAPNGGLMIDILHLVRMGIPFELLSTVPGDRIMAVELGDGAPTAVQNDIIIDGTDHRLVPGQGSFDIPNFLRAVQATGFDGPYGIEVVSIENRARSLEEAATINYEATLAQFAAV